MNLALAEAPGLEVVRPPEHQGHDVQEHVAVHDPRDLGELLGERRALGRRVADQGLGVVLPLDGELRLLRLGLLLLGVVVEEDVVVGAVLGLQLELALESLDVNSRPR